MPRAECLLPTTTLGVYRVDTRNIISEHIIEDVRLFKDIFFQEIP